MTTVPDLELTVRIGVLDRSATERLQAHVVEAVLWHGLGEHDARDLARGQDWCAAGRAADAGADEMVRALLLTPVSALTRIRLVATLRDTGYRAGPPDPLSLGRRVSHVLALVAGAELTTARQPANALITGEDLTDGDDA